MKLLPGIAAVERRWLMLPFCTTSIVLSTMQTGTVQPGQPELPTVRALSTTMLKSKYSAPPARSWAFAGATASTILISTTLVADGCPPHWLQKTQLPPSPPIASPCAQSAQTTSAASATKLTESEVGRQVLRSHHAGYTWLAAASCRVI